MQIVGRTFAALTPAMSSALDALAEGIVKTTNSAEPRALDQAIDTFSDDNLENAGVIALIREGIKIPVIAESAAFVSPADFATQFDNMSEKNQRFLDIQNHVQNSRFNQREALASCTNNLFGGDGIVQNLIGKNGLLAEAFADGSAQGPFHGEEKAFVVDWLPGGDENGFIVNWKGSDRGMIIDYKSADGSFSNDESRPMESLAPEDLSSSIYLPVMDESVNKLPNVDPSTLEGQKSLLVFQQQLEVLQGMEKTVKNQVALHAQISNSLTGKIMA